MWLDRFFKRKQASAEHVSDQALALFERVLEAARALPAPNNESAASMTAVDEAEASVRVEIVRLALPLYAEVEEERQRVLREQGSYSSEMPWYFVREAMIEVIDRALGKELPFEPGDYEKLIAWERGQASPWTNLDKSRKLLRTFQLAERLQDEKVRAWLRSVLELEERKERADRKWTKLARELLGETPVLPLADGEAWSDALAADLDAMDEEKREAWFALLMHASAGGGSAPTKKWSSEAADLAESVGRADVVQRLTTWFALVDKPLEKDRYVGPHARFPAGSLMLADVGQELLKGLCWCAAELDEPPLARTLGRLALSAYKKIPGVGPRAVKVGNAAILALSRTSGPDALGQLAMLRVKLKARTADKTLEKALNAAAESAGLAREDIEELAVPSYGFTQVGARQEELGEFRAELSIDVSGTTALLFVKADGKAVKSVPAAVKAEHAEELADLKAAAKDCAAMLSAQRERIDALFLEEKTWPFATWRERYLDHPLTGVIARALMWTVVETGGRTRTVFFDAKQGFVGARGEPVELVEEGATVRLWHPIESPVDDVLAWRRFVEDRGICQPFKQAHREIYLLTDAERTTATYSNRFAAHVLRQHQFNALCAARRWRNKLRMMVDDEYPPATRIIERHALRAEYWIEGAGTEYGRDTNESGAFLHLLTDQVRFYRTDAAENRAHAGGGGYAVARAGRAHGNEPVPLDRIPPLVLSEILRDVDLFVGVSSVGANPMGQDGGPENRYRDYWWEFGFGELSATGAGRRELLERLIPRLSIANVCSFADRFLVVKGKLRSYKIHLGSGNILMEPNDLYLCIVPDSSQIASSAGSVHLPFEGDRTLSIILSKAFLLAADEKIDDATILRQIRA